MIGQLRMKFFCFKDIALHLAGWERRHHRVRKLDLIVRLFSRIATGGQLLQRVVGSLVDGDFEDAGFIQFCAVYRRRWVLGIGLHQRIEPFPLRRSCLDAKARTDGSLAKRSAVMVPR